MKGRSLSIFVSTARGLARGVADVLLAQDCFVCGGRSGRDLLCPGCGRELPRLAEPLCPVCGLPSPGGAVCGGCLKNPPQFDATAALYCYAFPIDRLVQALKYGGRLPLAGFFAGALAARLDSTGIDCVVPLPLHRRRLRERGFNQAMEIARPLARRLGLPLLASACGRELDSAPQAGLPWQARSGNVRGVFDCTLDLSGRSVAVVDDVMTTGATLNEFARTLKNHGAARVTNWVVARTLPR